MLKFGPNVLLTTHVVAKMQVIAEILHYKHQEKDVATDAQRRIFEFLSNKFMAQTLQYQHIFGIIRKLFLCTLQQRLPNISIRCQTTLNITKKMTKPTLGA